MRGFTREDFLRLHTNKVEGKNVYLLSGDEWVQALFESNLDQYTKLVGITLWCSSEDKKSLRVSLEKLSKWTALSEDEAHDSLRELRDEGFLGPELTFHFKLPDSGEASKYICPVCKGCNPNCTRTHD